MYEVQTLWTFNTLYSIQYTVKKGVTNQQLKRLTMKPDY